MGQQSTIRLSVSYRWLISFVYEKEIQTSGEKEKEIWKRGSAGERKVKEIDEEKESLYIDSR